MKLDPTALDAAWRASFELAWQAWCSGTIPIGAVVSDPQNRVIATGRNRIFNADAPSGQLSGTWLAHAEINALLQLPANGHYERFAITSTTEPCLLCSGAIIMSLRGQVTVRYAATDPLAGGTDLLPRSAQGRRRDLQLQRLEHGAFVTLAEALNLAESLRRAPDGVVVRHYKLDRPALLACAEELEAVLRPYLFSDVRLDAVLEQIERVLRNHPNARP